MNKFFLLETHLKLLQETASVETYAEKVKFQRLPADTYFHVSPKYLGKTVKMQPRIPSNYFIKNKLENWNTERISASESVDGALTAMSDNIKGLTFYVYTIGKELKGLPNKDLGNYVPDAYITKEVWIMEPATFIFQQEIKVIRADKPHDFTLINGKTYTLWSWKWRVVANERTYG